MSSKTITIEARVNAPLEKVWESWTSPADIIHWNAASPDWCCPRATNDLRKGGVFTSRMEARDGSMGFDLEGRHEEVVPMQMIASVLGDGRKMQVKFAAEGNQTLITESFEPENIHPEEMQRAGWQAILDNFKQYTESKN